MMGGAVSFDQHHFYKDKIDISVGVSMANIAVT